MTLTATDNTTYFFSQAESLCCLCRFDHLGGVVLSDFLALTLSIAAACLNCTSLNLNTRLEKTISILALTHCCVLELCGGREVRSFFS